jgi:hypothetical protein
MEFEGLASDDDPERRGDHGGWYSDRQTGPRKVCKEVMLDFCVKE